MTKNEPLWGWDDGSLLFVPKAIRDNARTITGGDERRVQDYPDLYARLVEVCDSYFAEREPDARPRLPRPT